MCGIVGYVGKHPALPMLLDALSRLEYRGYDSAGVALLNGNTLMVRRRPGKLKELLDELKGTTLAGTIGIGHTRWATHGEPSERNAHPHVDCSGGIAVVHNGIVENYAALKAHLQRLGHQFRSQTDTEVLAHLIEEHAKQLPLIEAVRQALQAVEGSYALGLVAQATPHQLIVARCGSPLVVGVGDGEHFVASDVPALLGHTRRVVYVHDRELAVLTARDYQLTTLDGAQVRRPSTHVRWNVAAAQKQGYAHFMLKEIHEQPQAIADTLANRLLLDREEIQFDQRTRAFLERHVNDETQLVIISCGTAYHAGLVGEYMLEEYAQLPVDVELASEFRYRGPRLDQHTIVLAITQSGETADTLAGVRLAHEHGAQVLSICNVMGSSIARESDAVLYTHAGPEIAVASTKAYTAQLAVLYLLTLALAKQRRTLGGDTWKRLLTRLGELPRLVREALRLEPALQRCARVYAKQRNFYYLGRRYNFPAALEGALKLKEICPLIHAEGYAAGEMKHGPISLIRKGWPVVCIAPESSIYDKMRSNIEEMRARHGDVIAIASSGDQQLRSLARHVLPIPKTEEVFSPLLAAIPLQLLAYHIARLNHCDIDQPPNLAKSVTVE